jgi:hypothetical protein
MNRHVLKIKALKTLLPELFLTVSVIYYWTLTSNVFNPIAIGLLAILAFQIKNQNSTLGIIISLIVIALSLFLVLALISELSEFPNINQNWKNLAVFGSLYLGLNMLLAGSMFTKYIKLNLN